MARTMKREEGGGCLHMRELLDAIIHAIVKRNLLRRHLPYDALMRTLALSVTPLRWSGHPEANTDHRSSTKNKFFLKE